MKYNDSSQHGQRGLERLTTVRLVLSASRTASDVIQPVGGGCCYMYAFEALQFSTKLIIEKSDKLERNAMKGIATR